MIPTIDMLATGQRIKMLREQANMSVSQLANYLGFCGVNAIYKWQNGVSLPTLDNLVALGAVLGVGISEIIAIRKE